MKTPEALKALLQQVKQDNFQLPKNLDISDILSDMLSFIGHPDAELRDKLIYAAFWRWTSSGVLSATQMKRMLRICIDEAHLFYRIGESGTDSVFTRTFSVLIVPLVLYMHQQKAFLTETDIVATKEAVLRYCRQEKDYRGYVESKGWAHAMAHAADALDDIAKLPEIGEQDLLAILGVMKEMISNKDCVYICEEDERIAIAFLSVYQRKVISNSDICKWLNGFRRIKKPENLPSDMHQRINQKNFLRSLYFQFLSMENSNEIQKVIADILNGY